MARVTVEDCLTTVENRFELILKAAKRVHQLSGGTHRPLLDPGKDKYTIVALREIAQGYLDQVDTEEEIEYQILPITTPPNKDQGFSMQDVNEELSNNVLEESDDISVSDDNKDSS